ncbi:MAG: hypothetical protein LBC18_06205 [Opitutaceae bacterium]|jgi:hypothetical protein|nr:hypothetical protein [Opitutaceae bacterium]
MTAAALTLFPEVPAIFARRNAGDFVESEHPRDGAGKFKDAGAGAQAVRESLTITNTNVTRDDALKELVSLAGKPLENEETGIMAEINRVQRGKIVSGAALEKSKANGFTAGQHNAAAARMKTLWKHAILMETRPDEDGDKNIASIKRFAAPVIFEGETAAAYITAKESVRHGHRIYSLELTEIKKLRDKGEMPSGSPEGRLAPGAFEEIERRLLAKVNPEKTNACPPRLIRRPATAAEILNRARRLYAYS